MGSIAEKATTVILLAMSEGVTTGTSIAYRFILSILFYALTQFFKTRVAGSKFIIRLMFLFDYSCGITGTLDPWCSRTASGSVVYQQSGMARRWLPLAMVKSVSICCGFHVHTVLASSMRSTCTLHSSVVSSSWILSTASHTDNFFISGHTALMTRSYTLISASNSLDLLSLLPKSTGFAHSHHNFMSCLLVALGPSRFNNVLLPLFLRRSDDLGVGSSLLNEFSISARFFGHQIFGTFRAQ